MKFVHSDIRKNKPLIELLCVHAYQMNNYLISLTIEGRQGMLCDKGGRPQKFSSASQIRDFFAKCEVKQTQIILDSSFDEMIGNPTKPAPSGITPFLM